MTLTPFDLSFVVSRLPKDIVAMCRKYQVAVAGGFIRSTIAHEPVSDVDVFGQTKDSLKAIATELALSRKGRLLETQNAFTVLAPPR